MAAVTTKKHNGDAAVQLTFPTVFEYTYADEDMPLAYYPEGPAEVPALPEGTDLQAEWHQQKLADANRMAMAGVQATKNAERRFLLSHANYYGMPKAVLGQRIYANPSNGNQADIYPARRDQGVVVGDGEGFVGGVLRTAEGQSFGRQLLQARVAQLNAIDAAKASMLPDSSRLPPVAGEMAAEVSAEPTGGVPTNLMLELTAILQNIAALGSGFDASSMDVKDVVRALQLIFRVAPIATREELEQILSPLLDYLRDAEPAYLDLQDPGRGEDGAEWEWDAEDHRFTRVIFPLISQAAKYVKEMMKESNLTRQPRERVALSKALVKKYKLADVGAAEEAASSPYIQDIREDRRARPAVQRQLREIGRGSMHGGAQHAVVPMSSTFSKRAPTRENEEHAADADASFFGEGSMKPRHRVRGGESLRNTVHFDRDQRQVFGDRSGSFFAEGPAGDYKSTPGMELAQSSNPFRQPLDNTMQQPVQAALPVFPQGTPDADAAQIDAMATQMQGQGKAKKWIQGVAASMKKGAFTKQALRAHMTPEQFANEVLAHPDKYSLVTRRRAQFLKNIRRGGAEASPVRRPPPSPPARPINKPSTTTKKAAAETQKGKGKLGLTRASLPKTREGYMELAAQLKGMGHNLRVNKDSKLTSIRQNFIRKLGL